MISYRVGAADAEFLSKEFSGISEQDFTNLPFATMYIKLLIDGTPCKPFSMRGVRDEPSQTKELAQSIKQLSRLKYGKVKSEVDADIRVRTSAKTEGGKTTKADAPPAREGNV